MTNIVDFDLGVVKAESSFSEIYPLINAELMSDEYPWNDSRDGKVKEILDFKTIIGNPYRRLVGVNNRDINVFFLLAEAMWIWSGRKDVKFLTIFNKKMSDFSDDGSVFHAPYGFRLRHWGVRSEDKFLEENMHAAQGYDQIADAIRILSNNPNSRQVVMSIWNPDLDLGVATKDIPCNDIVMLKIRNGKLITTIANRSNDLHWGLPTNIFQFSFLTELIAGILGIELGTQTHNSQSLHIYDWNPITQRLLETPYGEELYRSGAEERRIDFNFSHEVPGNRLRELDIIINKIIDNLELYYNEGIIDNSDELQIGEFSKYLHSVFLYLLTYIKYKKAIKGDKEAIPTEAKRAMDYLQGITEGKEYAVWDVNIMALNFFVKRAGVEHSFIGKL